MAKGAEKGSASSATQTLWSFVSGGVMGALLAGAACWLVSALTSGGGSWSSSFSGGSCRAMNS